MSLQFDLFNREDRLLAIPIVFKDHIIHHLLSVQNNCYAVTNHLDIEAVPFAQLVISHFRRLAFIYRVIIQTT